VAIALVSLGTVATGDAGTLNSCAPAFGAATGAGHLLVAWVACAAGNFTLGTPAGWTSAGQAGSADANNVSADVFYKANSAAGETAPKFGNNGGTAGTLYAALAEFSGAATTTPLDRTAGLSGGATSPIVATATLADATSGELVLASGLFLETKAATTTTAHSFNNGATTTGNLNQDATSTSQHYRFSYGITTGNSVADSDSFSDTSMNLSVAALQLASFKLPAGAATSLLPPPAARRAFGRLGR
jgi:hypothetical protein